MQATPRTAKVNEQLEEVKRLKAAGNRAAARATVLERPRGIRALLSCELKCGEVYGLQYL
jgi:hypothetical protein